MKRGKTVNRQGIYSKVEPHAQKAIETLVMAMEKGNWPTRVGAAKVILAKLIPDLKASDINIGSEKPTQLFVNAGNGFVPWTISVGTAHPG